MSPKCPVVGKKLHMFLSVLNTYERDTVEWCCFFVFFTKCTTDEWSRSTAWALLGW